jgi:serine/threonine-protein kinase
MIGETVSHYKILEKLGGGGMGVVYKAEDTKLDRLVALKFLPPEWTRDENAKARFLHEAKAASKLDHTNICTIHEIGETADGQLFIAMALYEGETLKDKIEKGPLKIDEAIDIAEQIAQGLARAHEKEIVHRDIKPANILITGDKTVKIVDFGLAKLAGRTMLTEEGTTLGTVAYMSPEQTQGVEVGHRTDIWALGVVLYEMVTGQLPFKGDFGQAVTYSILNEDPEPMTGLRTGVPMELERIVLKALAKNPGERYQNVGDLLVDLSLLKKDLESLTPAARLTKTKLPRRKRIYLYSGVAIFLILLTVVGRSLLNGRSEVIDSIAVLPLDNLSGDAEQEYFVDGMTEALIAELSQIEALRVISRTSVMRYKGARKPLPEIGRELSVDAIIEGSVLHVGNRVRITAQLIETATDRHLWAKSYERDLQDILALQSEIARAIVREIKIAVTPEEETRLARIRTVNPEAYEACLKGYYYWNKRTEEGLVRSIEYFQEAIEKEPDYAMAYVGLADAYNMLGGYDVISPIEAYRKGKAAAIKALEIKSTLAGAHTSLAWTSMWYDWDWSAAEKEYQRAIELNNNYATAHHWYGWCLALTGRPDEAIGEFNHALKLDPLSLIINAAAGWNLYVARNYDQAIEHLQRTMELDPNFPRFHYWLGQSYVQTGMFEDAITEFRMAVSISPSSPQYVAALGHAYAVAGKRDEAQKVLDELKELSKRRYVSPFDIALVYTGLANENQAFKWLEEAYKEHAGWLVLLKVEPRLDSLRHDPRFQDLLRRMNFPENDSINQIE